MALVEKSGSIRILSKRSTDIRQRPFPFRDGRQSVVISRRLAIFRNRSLRRADRQIIEHQPQGKLFIRASQLSYHESGHGNVSAQAQLGRLTRSDLGSAFGFFGVDRFQQRRSPDSFPLVSGYIDRLIDREWPLERN